MAGFLAEKGLRVLQNGYNVIPIRPGEKQPSIKKWQHLKTTETDIKQWLSNGRADNGVGITTATTPLVDLDIEDKPMLRELIEYLSTNIADAPVRVGNPPKRGLLFRSESPFRKITSKEFIDDEGRRAQVEILGDGQQFVAYHIHPDTKKPYRWIGDESPEVTPANELPVMTDTSGKSFVAFFERRARERGWQEKRRPGTALATRPAGDRPAFMDDDDDPFGIGTGPLGMTEDEVREKLLLIPNEDIEYDEWLKIGFAVHHETEGSPFGEELWREWSEQSSKHDDTKFEKSWNSFGKQGSDLPAVTFRYIIKLAKEFEKANHAEQLTDILNRMGFAQTADDLRTIAAECRRIELDVIDRSRVITVLRKCISVVSQTTLTLREAREMVRYQPQDGEIPDWLEGWCYLQHAGQFYNRKTQQRITREAFDAGFGRYVGPDTVASKYALETVRIPIYHMTIYLPFEEETFEDANGLSWINTYSTKTLPLVPEAWSARDRANVRLVRDHAMHLFDRERDVALFHSWLAYIVQTNRRPNWAVILQGAEGTGKTFYADMMAAVLGGPNVYILGAETLSRSDFTSWAEGHQLVFMEELKQHGHNKFDIPNRLKPYITNSSVEIHCKGLSPYNVPNATAYMAATNYRDSMPITVDDSRYFVLFSRYQTRGSIDAFKAANPDYYSALWRALEQSPGAIRKWLLSYKLHPEFDASNRAPFSHGKQRMINESKSEDQQAIEELIAEKVHPLVSHDLIVVHILRDLMVDESGVETGLFGNPVKLRHVLVGMGFASLGRIRIGTERFSCWTTSHELIEADADRIRKEIAVRIDDSL